MARLPLSRAVPWVRWVLGLGLLCAVTTTPVTLQRTVEDLRFPDLVGTVPVEVTLVHNGYSVLDTGVLGSVFWDRTGVLGYGVRLRVTGPPNAGGTLASYVDPEFVRVNAQSVDDPEAVGRAYTNALRERLVRGLLLRMLLLAAFGGPLLALVLRPRLAGADRRRRVVTLAGVGGGLLGLSAVVAAVQATHWAGSDPPPELYPLSERPEVSFTSPQALEVAEQVRPFIEKNTERLRESARTYRETAEASVRTVVPAAATRLVPREGERIVVREADPQGSLVGTRVRVALYDELTKAVGEDAVVARSVSGDVSSNGTVGERGFVDGESEAFPSVPVVAVKGDHDSAVTVRQLEDSGAEVVDREVVEVGGLSFTGGADPEFKALFGGRITNPSGVTPAARGIEVREVVDDRGDEAPVHVVLHQPESALGYLGTTLDRLRATQGHESEPWDDGIPDLPPGSVAYGHWHEADGPFVVWNTDGDEVTWTVVDQLGTSGGVEEQPTINRFSTPTSPPLKPVMVRLHYVDEESGLVTGAVTMTISVEGDLTVGPRVEIGLR